ncbi:exosortase family protein XrtF [Psychroserpens sp. NJDZ02]|uniref:exosortase family protein XrtF n=1 Tax=Psychroserpens sp. NJDZ02 TaxID=2570561 RepID=UPI0010A94C98|nr:exosortase family protein XrtF [Psychroserpens sp. NJDZ02]QCE40525.1 exosortase family protein XrtF [Psychroserpens sp. NJDZ02]
MKALLLKYKPVIKFIITFLAVYGVLSMGYNFYLDLSKVGTYYPDYITNLVAVQTQNLLEVLGYNTQMLPHPNEPSIMVVVEGKYLARVIEGCNGTSIIILFVSFIIAFAGRFKTTVFYVIAGSVLIYVVNLVRIVILSIGLYHYPWREEVLHTVIFPGIIYGMVFLLWMFWVNRFSHINK